MNAFYSLLSLIAVLLAAFFLTRLLAPRHRVEGALIYVVVLSTIILWLGYLLSALNQLRSLACWAVASVLVLALVLAPILLHPRLRTTHLRKLTIPRDIEQRIYSADFRRFDTLLLLVLTLCMASAAVVNFLIVICLEPANSDTLGYHIPRMLYYLERGNLHYFGADYWAMVIHPKVATVLILYTYLIGDLNANLTQLVQYLAYFVSVLSVYGISRHLGLSRRRSAFAALIFSLLMIVLMEASTAQNDLLLTAFTGCLLYFLLAYRTAREMKFLWLAAVALALALGVKATMLLVLPSLFCIILFILRPAGGERLTQPLNKLGVGVLGVMLALVVITWPAGYGENLQHFGNPLGPKNIRVAHSCEGMRMPELLKNGGANLLRYSLDFVALDGVLPSPLARSIQSDLTQAPRWILHKCGIELTARKGVPTRFHFERLYLADEDNSFWGVFGPLLVWPVVLLTVVGCNQSPDMRVFASAALLYVVVLSFASPYDPWCGRYFMTAALFAAPPLGHFAFPRLFLGKLYIALVVILGCALATFSIFERKSTLVFPLEWQRRWLPSTFSLGHTAQLTRNVPNLRYALLIYEDIVPEHTVVALDTKFDLCEYLFFGDRLSRRLIALRPFVGKRLAIPADAQYLLYSADSPYARKNDSCLCVNDPCCGTLFVRKLK